MLHYYSFFDTIILVIICIVPVICLKESFFNRFYFTILTFTGSNFQVTYCSFHFSLVWDTFHSLHWKVRLISFLHLLVRTLSYTDFQEVSFKTWTCKIQNDISKNIIYKTPNFWLDQLKFSVQSLLYKVLLYVLLPF